MSTRSKSVYENKEIAEKLADIHDTFVVVPADKSSLACIWMYVTVCMYVHACVHVRMYVSSSYS